MSDLKLEIILQTLLDAKGFEDAQDALKKTVAVANAASDAGKKVGESYGGSRGPVADLTRVLLLNVGVTGAAGEAAKAAGTAMYFMEGAATAVNVAIAGGVAAVALLLPHLIDWLSNTKEQNQEQKDLLSTMRDQLPVIEKYAEAAKKISDSAAIQLQAQRGEMLRKQADELAKITAEIDRMEPLLREAFAAGMKGQALTQEYGKQATKLVELKARQADLRLALSQNISVEEMYDRKTKEVTKSTETRSKVTGELTKEEKDRARAAEFAADQEIDASNDILAYTKKVDKARADAYNAEARRQENLAEYKRQDVALTRQQADEEKLKAATVAEIYTNTVTTAVAAFTKNKAILIAAAIADTWAAVNKTLAAGGYLAIPLAAVVAAQGLANVQRIRQQNVGFDDPFADMTARRLGRKSAVDFVANFGAGFHSGMGMAMSGGGIHNSTTINRGATINGGVNIHGFVGAGKTELMKQLNRELIKVQRLENRTTVGR